MQTPKSAMIAMVLTAAVLAGFGWWQFGGVGLSAGKHEHGHEHEERGHGDEGPLPPFPAELAERLGGRLLEVESERENGRWFYEVKVLDPSGRKRRLLIDAESGAVVGRER